MVPNWEAFASRSRRLSQRVPTWLRHLIRIGWRLPPKSNPSWSRFLDSAKTRATKRNRASEYGPNQCWRLVASPCPPVQRARRSRTLSAASDRSSSSAAET